MKMLVQSAVAVTAVCLLAGCETTGFSPRETPMVSYPNYILSLESGPAGAPQKIVTPIRLAVAQIGEDAPPETLLDKLAGQKTLVASVNGLPLPDDDGNQIPYSRPGRPGPDYSSRVKTVCSLAQAAGADYVFLVGGTVDSWRQNNSLSVLDATIVGAAIVPAARIHVEGRGAGALISTATCRPVLFVSADSRTTGMSPDFLVDGKTAALDAQVRDQLAAKLTDQFLDRLATCASH
jgi:uncharacterized membrane protein (UPF0136 family)